MDYASDMYVFNQTYQFLGSLPVFQTVKQPPASLFSDLVSSAGLWCYKSGQPEIYIIY